MFILAIVIAPKPNAAHLRDMSRIVLKREVLLPCVAAVVTVAAIIGISAISRQALLIAAIVALVTAVLMERGIRSRA